MLRKLAIAIALVAGAAPIPEAAAQPDPSGLSAPAPVDDPRSLDDSGLKKPEHLTAKPSGFWTSNRPAVGGAYRWRIMGMGLLAFAITTFFVVRMLRRVSANRVPLPDRWDRGSKK